MSSSRRRARPSEPAADLLTSLPAHLLDDILTRLDLRDAVRTSALSRAWRRRWEVLPYLPLSFLDKPGTPPVAVDRALVRYPGNISDFSFHLDEHSVGRVADWLIALCNRRVKSINIRFSSDAFNGFILHSSIYLSTHLVYLELHNCSTQPLPVGFIGFPVLQQLKLEGVEFPHTGERQLEAIISNSPLLHTLTISGVHIVGGVSDWVIRGASLRSLTIISDLDYGWEVAEVPSLHEATFIVEDYARFGDFGGFLAGLAQVRKLVLFTCFPSWTEGHLLETLACTFDNLRILTLGTHFDETRTILSTFSLLRNAPKLEELEIEIHGNSGLENEANAEFQNAQWTDGMCANLHVVRMEGVLCSSNEMCFIELVLSKAAVLRAMSISLGYKSSKSNEDALLELIAYKRASPHAQIFFHGKEGHICYAFLGM